ncbi:polysaccharide biosynthesis tyrosine autokinase [Comamonas sp. BIGb0124]|uniref:polysaccharide biosynthesis tyrosine autokinase n=1 Tax=Comamonas sp. BIGb0124 TaxID=2485130 RepID=UPI00351A5345
MEEDSDINLREYFDILLDNKWLIASVTTVALAVGVAYAILAKPVYQTDLLIQVEDSSGASSAAQSLLGAASSLFDVKTPASGEIEVLRSRMVIGRAVDATKIYISAQPRYVPVIGRWMASRATDLSTPGFLGAAGYVSGKENITVSEFNVPSILEGEDFILTVGEEKSYTLTTANLEQPVRGVIGVPLLQQTALGPIALTVDSLQGMAGAQFVLNRLSRDGVVDDIQTNLLIAEKGRQSGIINVSLQDSDKSRLVTILDEIGEQYVQQNVQRKAAEAEKTLAFLDVQLPDFKKQLESSEAAYNQYRNRQGTIALDEEAKLALTQTVDLQTKLFEAQQQRRALEERFTSSHPSVQTLDRQIQAWQAQIAGLNTRIKGMPTVQQDALRFQRDIQVNTELYQSLLNNSMQLQLVKEGKTGNVRLLDNAVVPIEPVKPRKGMAVALAFAIGFLLSVILAFIRNSMFRGIRSAQEIEAHTGLNVYTMIPLSPTQKVISQQVANKAPGIHLLAHSHAADPAIESLRSLRTSLQFAMLEAPNNRIVITGATPGLGKSFVSTNFAAIVASGGKRVLLIDADMRKGYINQFFGLPRNNGLSDLIVGSIDAQKAIHKNVLSGLDVLTTGTFPPNPAELLMSEAFARIVERVSSDYDMVIIDTAPVLVAADTAAAAKTAGIVMLVARAELTQTGELNESVKRLAHSGCSVNGVLFNGIDTTRRYAGAYGYKYGGYRYANYDYAPSNKS